jgi:hypothetical protein
VAAFLLAAGAGPDPVGAADPPWDPPACPPTTSAAEGRAWFRLDATLDRRGSLAGQRLAVGDAVAGSRRRLDLARESFAAGPFGDLVLVGSDDGRRSVLRLVDAVRACAATIGEDRDVVRSGLVTPDGTAIVEHRVDRRTRADLGVWRRPLRGGDTVRILGPIVVDPTAGPTFATELAWGTDGRLAVMSCGQIVCRARVLDMATGEVDAIGDVGQLVGLTGGALVAYRPCAGLPCTIETIDVASGRRAALVARAGLATLVGVGRERLVTEAVDGERTVLHVLDLATGRTDDLGEVPAGYRLQTSAARAGSGISTPVTVLALLPDGRVPLDVGRGHGRLLDTLTGNPAPIREVRR